MQALRVLSSCLSCACVCGRPHVCVPQETLIADYRVIDVWARRGMMCGRDSKEREQRSGGTSTVCFYLLCARHHQAQQATFPMDIFRGHRRRVCYYPEIHLRIKLAHARESTSSWTVG